jgi:membrane protease subunit HflK
VLGATSKVVIDQKAGGGGNLLYLPLDRLMQQAAPATAPAAAMPTEAAPSVPASRAAPAEIPPQVNDGPRGRESLRARDR